VKELGWLKCECYERGDAEQQLLRLAADKFKTANVLTKLSHNFSQEEERYKTTTGGTGRRVSPTETHRYKTKTVVNNWQAMAGEAIPEQQVDKSPIRWDDRVAVVDGSNVTHWGGDAFNAEMKHIDAEVKHLSEALEHLSWALLNKDPGKYLNLWFDSRRKALLLPIYVHVMKTFEDKLEGVLSETLRDHLETFEDKIKRAWVKRLSDLMEEALTRPSEDFARLASVKAILQILKAEGVTPTVVFDANIGYKVENRHMDQGEMATALGGGVAVEVVPSGTVADRRIVELAEQRKATIVSNDLFRDSLRARPIPKRRGFFLPQYDHAELLHPRA